MKSPRSSANGGFTYIELAITITILALIMIGVMFGDRLQIFKGYDAVKKSDLNKLKIAFENYYNDHDCYPHDPQTDVLDTCTTSAATNNYLTPYIDRIPCDPTTKRPYTVWSDAISDARVCPQWYQLYTHLSNENDPIIAKLGCSVGCGPSNAYSSDIFNYGVSSGNTSPSESLGADARDDGIFYYCSSVSDCTVSLPGQRCPSNKTFSQPFCRPSGCAAEIVCIPTGP